MTGWKPVPLQTIILLLVKYAYIALSAYSFLKSVSVS